MARNKEHFNRYMAQWRKEHPDSIMAMRIRSAARLLTRNGWSVAEPTTTGGNIDE